MSQVNHNYDYLTVVDGHTVWERLRVIRNFLTDRRKALKIARLHQEKFEATKESMDEWERREAEILNEDQESLIQDCIDEITFLEKFESLLMVEAEKERVPGKSDREMYEINYVKESQTRLINLAKSEMIAVGHVNPDTMRQIMRDPIVADRLAGMGLIGTAAPALIRNGLTGVQLLLENKDALTI